MCVFMFVWARSRTQFLSGERLVMYNCAPCAPPPSPALPPPIIYVDQNFKTKIRQIGTDEERNIFSSLMHTRQSLHSLSSKGQQH